MFIDFSELNNHFFTVSNVFAVKQIYSGKTKFEMHEPRPTDALFLFANTTGVCYQKGLNPIFIPHGALVYMPRNSKYMWESSPVNNGEIQENILFEFTLNHVDVMRGAPPKRQISCCEKSGEQIAFSDKVSLVTTHYGSLYKNLLYTLIDSHNSEQCMPLSVYCAAYNFFNVLSTNCKIETENNMDARIIKGSLKELECYEGNPKTISEIAKSCNISTGYYEKLFKNYTGISPIEYRSIHKINKIKMLLQAPEITLDEITEQIGFCDSGYLCRFFKQKTGMTPKQYRKIYISQTQPDIRKLQQCE